MSAVDLANQKRMSSTKVTDRTFALLLVPGTIEYRTIPGIVLTQRASELIPESAVYLISLTKLIRTTFKDDFDIFVILMSRKVYRKFLGLCLIACGMPEAIQQSTPTSNNVIEYESSKIPTIDSEYPGVRLFELP